MTIEIVDFAIKHCDLHHKYVTHSRRVWDETRELMVENNQVLMLSALNRLWILIRWLFEDRETNGDIMAYGHFDFVVVIHISWLVVWNIINFSIQS